MFIGAICHDLDHRGVNNKFMIDSGSPLAVLYNSSSLEHHHFNMTKIIVEQVYLSSMFRILLVLDPFA